MPEEETFCVFVQLMNKHKLRELYKPSMAKLSTCFYQLENLVEVYCHTHLYIIATPTYTLLSHPPIHYCHTHLYNIIHYYMWRTTVPLLLEFWNTYFFYFFYSSGIISETTYSLQSSRKLLQTSLQEYITCLYIYNNV